MSYCTKCGAATQEDAFFCSSCGQYLAPYKTAEPVGSLDNRGGLGLKLKIILGVLLVVLLSGGGFWGWNTFGTEFRLDSKLALAVKYLNENKYEEAILAYKEAIKIDPRNMEARVGLARAYIGIGDFGNARNAVAASQDLGPITQEQYQKLVEAYLAQGKLDEAGKLLAEALGQYPGSSILADVQQLLNQAKARVAAAKPPEEAQPVIVEPAAPPIITAPVRPAPVSVRPAPRSVPQVEVTKPDSGSVSRIF